jgi:Protein of unknown function (DUF3172)
MNNFDLLRPRNLGSLASQQAGCSLRCHTSQVLPYFRVARGALVVRSEGYDDGSRGPMQRQQGPPRRANYNYAPPAASGSGGPPSYPPSEPEQTPPPDGGMPNITKAFVAGAFILGEFEGCSSVLMKFTSPPPPRDFLFLSPPSLTKILLLSIYNNEFLGMGAGIWFDSEVTFEPNNVASTVLVDTKTPNSEVCMANGYSSMVFDERIFVSFNPFNVYVSQPEVKPGCVLRRANVNVLESRGLVDQGQVQACKRNMNTFAFVGDLAGTPQVSCVYHSEEAENQFLRNPQKSVQAAAAVAAGGGDGAPPPAQFE